MEKFTELVSGWNGNVIFWICFAFTVAVAAIAVILSFRLRVGAVPITAAAGILSALFCYFVTSYGAQAAYCALYAALLIAVGVILTAVAAILEAVARRKAAKKEKNSGNEFGRQPCAVEICAAAAPETVEKECGVPVATAPAAEPEAEYAFDVVLPDSALPEMSAEEVDNAVSEAEANGGLTAEEGKKLITQIAKLRALPGAGQENKKKLNDLQKRITDMFSAKK